MKEECSLSFNNFPLRLITISSSIISISKRDEGEVPNACKLFTIEAFMPKFFDYCFDFNSEVTFNPFHSLLCKSTFLRSLYLSIKSILRAYVADESSTREILIYGQFTRSIKKRAVLLSTYIFG